MRFECVQFGELRERLNFRVVDKYQVTTWIYNDIQRSISQYKFLPWTDMLMYSEDCPSIVILLPTELSHMNVVLLQCWELLGGFLPCFRPGFDSDEHTGLLALSALGMIMQLVCKSPEQRLPPVTFSACYMGKTVGP